MRRRRRPDRRRGRGYPATRIPPWLPPPSRASRTGLFLATLLSQDHLLAMCDLWRSPRGPPHLRGPHTPFVEHIVREVNLASRKRHVRHHFAVLIDKRLGGQRWAGHRAELLTQDIWHLDNLLGRRRHPIRIGIPLGFHLKLSRLEKSQYLAKFYKVPSIIKDLDDVDRNLISRLPRLQTRNILSLDDHRRNNAWGFGSPFATTPHVPQERFPKPRHLLRHPQTILNLQRRAGFRHDVVDHAGGRLGHLLHPSQTLCQLVLGPFEGRTVVEQQVGALPLTGNCIHLLKEDLECLWIFRRNGRWPIGKNADLTRLIHRTNDDFLRPTALCPSHQKIAAPEPSRVDEEVDLGRS